MSAVRVRQIALALTALLAVAAALRGDHNLLFLAVLIGVLGLLTFGRARRTWLMNLETDVWIRLKVLFLE